MKAHRFPRSIFLDVADVADVRRQVVRCHSHHNDDRADDGSLAVLPVYRGTLHALGRLLRLHTSKCQLSDY